MSQQDLDPQTQALLDLFDAAKADPAKRQTLLHSPLEALSGMGAIDPTHQAAVLQGLQAAAFALAPAGEAREAQSPLLRAQASNPFEKDFHVSAHWWGIVLRMDQPAVEALPKGVEAVGTLAKAAMGAISASAAIGPTAPGVMMGLSFWGAIFTAYVVVIPMISQGKGVYLTLTWPQIALFAASAGLLGPAMLPIPTAVV